MTKKFWMVAMSTILFGLTTTGCPDGDDCASDPSLCDPDSDTDTDAGADADSDADPDTTETGADADTTEDTACPTCPNVTGDWQLTYYSNETHVQWINSLHLDQDGINITGYDEDCEYTGTISEDGTLLSITGDCPPQVLAVTADASAYSWIDGTFSIVGTSATGTWQADRQ